MPTVKSDESLEQYLERCVPVVLKEQGTKSREHAVAKCNGMWEQSREVDNSFCPTGKGGGVDPSCGKGSTESPKSNTSISQSILNDHRSKRGLVRYTAIRDSIATEAKNRGYTVYRSDSNSTNSVYLVIGKKTEHGGISSDLQVRISDHATSFKRTGVLKDRVNLIGSRITVDYLTKILDRLPSMGREGEEILLNESSSFPVPPGIQVLKTNAFCPTGKGGGVDPTCSPGEFPSVEAAHKEAKKDWKAWAKQLKPHHFQALDDYQSGAYQGDLGGEGGVFDKLRKGEKLDIGETNMILRLGYAVRGAETKRDVMVFRGLGYKETNYKVGDVVEDKAFMSTSMVRSHVEGVYADTEIYGSPTILELKLPKGTPAAYLDARGKGKSMGEAEVLLPQSTKYKVISVAKDEKGRIVVRGEVVEVWRETTTNSTPTITSLTATDSNGNEFSVPKSAITNELVQSLTTNATVRPNPLLMDPTGTGKERKALERAILSRLKLLKQVIVETIVTEDAFGLKDRPSVYTSNLASTQVNITDPKILTTILDIQNRIDPADLVEFEDKSHVTIRYGLYDLDPKRVEWIASQHSSVRAKLGGLSIFPAKESDSQRGGPEFDVLKIDVSSKDLESINRHLGILPNTTTHPDYHPHLTIAYLKPGTGQKYVGESGLEGVELEFKSMVYSDDDRKKTEIVFNAEMPPDLTKEDEAILDEVWKKLAKETANNAFCPTGKGGGVDPTCSPGKGFGKSLAKLDVDEESLVEALQYSKLKNLPFDLSDIPNVVGSRKGSKVTADVVNNKLHIIVRDNKIGLYAERHVYKIKDKWVIENVEFRVGDKYQGQGIGTEVFGRQVEFASKFGIAKIVTSAERNSGVNGYYTWARLGYDGPIPKGITPPNKEKKISDLMKTESGRNWWKENGTTFVGEFDLSKGSNSRKVFESYVKSKGLTVNLITEIVFNAFCPTGKGGGVDPTCGKGSAKWRTSDQDKQMQLDPPDDPTKLFHITTDKDLLLSGERTEHIWEGDTGKGFHVFDNLDDAEWYLKNTKGKGFSKAEIVQVNIPLDELANDNDHAGRAYYSREFKLSYVSNRANPTTNSGIWEFVTDDQKVDEFIKWIRSQMSVAVLGTMTTLGTTDPDHWLMKHIQDTYTKGMGKVFEFIRKPIFAEKMPHYEGTKAEFLKSAFTRPVSPNRVKLLAGRAYSELSGMTDKMATQMQRSLTDGFIRGESPRDIARQLVKDVDGLGRKQANMIASTEITRAYNEGQLDSMEELGVEDVGVSVEWRVSKQGVTVLGNPSPCPVCAPLNGIVLKISEARGLLPRHPFCRCAWVVSGVGESTKGQKRSQQRIVQAVKSSLLAERPKRKKTAAKPSRWAGSKAKIGKNRPKSILD